MNGKIWLNRNYEVIQTIRNEFPALSYHSSVPNDVKGLFQIVHQFTKYTKLQLTGRKDAEVMHCYNVASEILYNGSNIAKAAIENVFVYGISTSPEASLSVSKNTREVFSALFKQENRLNNPNI